MVEQENTAAPAPVLNLLQAINAYRARAKEQQSGADLAAELKVLRHSQDLLELEFAELAANFADTEEYDAQGSVSPSDWVRHNCRVTGSSASGSLAVGKHLEKLSESVAAVEAGAIGYAQLAIMARTAETLEESSTAAPFEEAALLAKARECTPGRLWHYCYHLRHAADPRRFAEDEQQSVEQRRLTLIRCEDGSLLLNGRLDSAGGAAVRSALEPLARRVGDDDYRCRERRYADAIVELATHAMDAGTTTQRPHLQVTTSLETLRGLAGSPAGDMQFSVPISAAMVRRLACDSTITRVVLGSESMVIDVGRARRVVSGSLRRALTARDGHCKWPRCDRPAAWSHAHHVVHWARGGGTDLTNLVLICHRHHWMAHEGGWQLVRTADGDVLTIPPRPPGLREIADFADDASPALSA